MSLLMSSIHWVLYTLKNNVKKSSLMAFDHNYELCVALDMFIYHEALQSVQGFSSIEWYQNLQRKVVGFRKFKNKQKATKLTVKDIREEQRISEKNKGILKSVTQLCSIKGLKKKYSKLFLWNLFLYIFLWNSHCIGTSASDELPKF